MEALFYLLSVISVVSAITVILNMYPIYALLFLITYFLSIACIFFILGAYLAGALQFIIYSGAIMVLFVFVVMILNVDSLQIENTGVMVYSNFRKLLLIFILLMILLYIVSVDNSACYSVCRKIITLSDIGLKLFNSYIFFVEMASMLLLASLVISLRIGHSTQCNIKK